MNRQAKHSVELLGGPSDGKVMDVDDDSWRYITSADQDGQLIGTIAGRKLIGIDGHAYFAEVFKGRKVLRLFGPRLPPMPGGDNYDDPREDAP